MSPTGDTTFALPEVGGLEHRPERIPSHLQLGATDTGLLHNTVAMTVSTRQVMGRVRASVTITNTGAGHHVPTDFPVRNMILIVTATDGQGQPMALQGGATVPDWGGSQAGEPGAAFAKVLRDVATGEPPVVSYWKQTSVISDTRIPALGSDTSAYVFTAPIVGGPVTVTAELRFRRAFQEVMEIKGWARRTS